MTKEEIVELRGRDKRETRLAKLGDAVERRFSERASIPCIKEFKKY